MDSQLVRRLTLGLFGFAIVVACGRGKPEPERGAEQGAAGAVRQEKTGGCSGTLTGPVSGAFTCGVTVNHYYEGSEVVEGRRSAIVTILSNPYDPTHTRPATVKHVGGNIEISGEPRPGTYTRADAGGTTTFAVTLDDGRSFDRLQSLTLTLSRATAGREVDALGIKSRIYEVGGRFEATVADPGGAEVRITASF
jgi:hypothetical protein